MKLSRRQMRQLIESVIFENENVRKPIELTGGELADACVRVNCPKDKVNVAVGFRGFNKEGSMPADIEDAIRNKLRCGPDECVIKQAGVDMIFVGWKK